jgi:hypothetical protein
MRSINLLKIAAEAELMRLRAWMQRHAQRGVYGAVATVFGVAMLALGEVAGCQALLLKFQPIPAALILLGINLLITVVFGLLAARSAPGGTEWEALQVRQQALEAAPGSVAFTMTLPAAASLLRGVRAGATDCHFSGDKKAGTAVRSGHWRTRFRQPYGARLNDHRDARHHLLLPRRRAPPA